MRGNNVIILLYVKDLSFVIISRKNVYREIHFKCQKSKCRETGVIHFIGQKGVNKNTPATSN